MTESASKQLDIPNNEETLSNSVKHYSEFEWAIACNPTILGSRSKLDANPMSLSAILLFADTYASQFRREFAKTIKYSPTIFTNEKDNIKTLIVSENLNREYNAPNREYNAVYFESIQKLSKNGRINLVRSADVLESVDIFCGEPSEIQSVILYSRISVPKGTVIDWQTFDYEKHLNYIENYAKIQKQSGISDEELSQAWVYHENKLDSYYLPIKVVTDFPTNRIRFFETPILLCRVYASYSIEVKYKYPNSFGIQGYNDYQIPIRLNSLLLSTVQRRIAMKDSHLGLHI
jgi:hypothetical protein